MNVDIKRISETETGGAWVMAYIPRFTEVKQYFTNNMAKAWLEIDDNRRISAQQRGFIFAILDDIAVFNHSFCNKELKEYYKGIFIRRILLKGKIRDYISLSNCTMTEANELIDELLNVAFEYGIPLQHETIDLLQDGIKWQYMSIKHRKCCICGKQGEIHHYDTIGMGNDRKTLDDSNKRKMCLCRIHHTQSHSMSREEFCDKYHVTPIIYKEG